GADRTERVVVDLRPGDDRYGLVEQTGQLAQDAALGLTAQSEQDDVMSGQERIDDLRDDGVLVTDYAVDNFSFVIFAREQVIAAAKGFDQVVTDFVFDRASAVTNRFQLAKGLRFR